jgi:uncharacterized protein
MRYRKFGKLDWESSVLAFGAMRLPTNSGGMLSGDVDEEESIKMIRHAIDSGVNLVDSAYLYHLGKSEVVLGKALRDGYRKKVMLSTKSPTWGLEKADDFNRFLDEQLTRLQVDSVDFYLLHGLGADRWEKMLELGIIQRAEAAVDDGRVAHVGFSFHGDTEAFKKIVDGYDGWAMCLIQHNYMDTEHQAGTEGLMYAASRGIAVAIMEPLRGGTLANPPGPVLREFEVFEEKRSPADWALQWLWDRPEVSTVLSGMSSMKQLEENLRSADEAEVASITPEAREMLSRVRSSLEARAPIPCTRCGYCMPCPSGVDIPTNIEFYNEGVMYEDWSAPRFKYLRGLTPEKRAVACENCGECEEACPQDIPIGEWMPKVHDKLSGQ